MCGSHASQAPARAPRMKNFAYTGDAGSHSPTRTTEYPSAASPLILIVEDHEDTRVLLRYLLEKRGYLVVETEDGEAGVRADWKRRRASVTALSKRSLNNILATALASHGRAAFRAASSCVSNTDNAPARD